MNLSELQLANNKEGVDPRKEEDWAMIGDGAGRRLSNTDSYRMDQPLAILYVASSLIYRLFRP